MNRLWEICCCSSKSDTLVYHREVGMKAKTNQKHDIGMRFCRANGWGRGSWQSAHVASGVIKPFKQCHDSRFSEHMRKQFLSKQLLAQQSQQQHHWAMFASEEMSETTWYVVKNRQFACQRNQLLALRLNLGIPFSFLKPVSLLQLPCVFSDKAITSAPRSGSPGSYGKELQNQGSAAASEMEIEKLKSDYQKSVQMGWKDIFGFNLAAMDHIQQLLASRSDALFQDARSKLLEIHAQQSKRLQDRSDTGEFLRKKKKKA
ncbi:hypothetical protein KIW84_014569 [Lathyrus oleraceus]|uniref:Uncharacterized protein n=1 Tax=Pisum sativum TaxID=3888 RepID=A0A9D5BNK6_PEA|nr:hypothetical protein KIW84_014567 [Pisum sativum]KAI5446771.1 hypothetical protein KIW84_014568 [Pisum sativum]KAI5446772.1 hypothetical protein KIW84_014569 [Pisum sativum]